MPLEQPPLGERHPEVSTTADDNVVVDRHIEELAGFDELPCEPQVFSTWRRVSTWVVVSKE
jgi:hypothetical protein